MTFRMDRSSRVAWVGLGGALLLYVCFTVAHVFMVDVYRPGDERRHTQYAVVLESKGRLPTMRETRAANHPPLYYALVAKTALRGVKSADGIDAAVQHARLISMAFGAVALVYAFLIVRLLLPRHPAVAVHATAIMAVIPSYANSCATLSNDSLAFAGQFAMIYGALLILIRGPTTVRLLALGIYLAVVGLTRISGVLVMPVALLAVLVGGYRHLGGSRLRRASSAALLGGALAAVVALSCGWFYLRNLAGSGDVTGQSAILDQVRNHPVRPPLEVIFAREKWLELHDETWGRLAGLVDIKDSIARFARWLTLLSTVGAAVALARARVWRRLGDWRSPAVLAWVIVAGVVASVFLPALVYHARGGGLHQRYVFGALPFCTLLLAIGCTWTRHALAPLSGFAAAFVLGLSVHWSYAALLVRKPKGFPLEQALAVGLGNPALKTVWLLAAIAVGLGAVVYALANAHASLHEPPASAP